MKSAYSSATTSYFSGVTLSVKLIRARGARGFEGDPAGASPGVGGHEHQESHYSAIPWDKEGEGSRGVSGGPAQGGDVGRDYGDAVPGGGSCSERTLIPAWPRMSRDRLGFLPARRDRRKLRSSPVRVGAMTDRSDFDDSVSVVEVV